MMTLQSKCSLCGKTFTSGAVGDVYTSYDSKLGNEIWTIYICDACLAQMKPAEKTGYPHLGSILSIQEIDHEE
jgi:DNA-directed RNA polymerase subunit RPC12/RpoP